MSLRPRQHVIVGGIRRTRAFHYFGCQTCRRVIPLAPFDVQHGMWCPFCEFELGPCLNTPRTRLLSMSHRPQSTEYDRPMIRPRDGRIQEPRSRAVWLSETEIEPLLAPQMTLQSPELQQANRLENDPNGHDHSANELIEELTQMDRPGPPPATTAEIEALPMIAIVTKQLQDEPNCPICKETFKIGGEARALPCDHFYHSDCIVPWLHIHNTCPICRHRIDELPGNDNNWDQVDGADEQGRFEDGPSLLTLWWSQLSSLWVLLVSALQWIFRRTITNSPSTRVMHAAIVTGCAVFCISAAPKL